KAAEVLGRIGPRAKSAIPDLLEVLKGSDNEARVQAALALWRLGHRAEDVIPVLAGALRSPSAPPVRNPLTPLGRFGVPGAPRAPVCQQAARALGLMGPEAQAAVPALTD